jgi:hypothetical protein
VFRLLGGFVYVAGLIGLRGAGEKFIAK